MVIWKRLHELSAKEVARLSTVGQRRLREGLKGGRATVRYQVLTALKDTMYKVQMNTHLSRHVSQKKKRERNTFRSRRGEKNQTNKLIHSGGLLYLIRRFQFLLESGHGNVI